MKRTIRALAALSVLTVIPIQTQAADIQTALENEGCSIARKYIGKKKGISTIKYKIESFSKKELAEYRDGCNSALRLIQDKFTHKNTTVEIWILR